MDGKTERRKRLIMLAPERFQNAVKLLVLYQCTLEQMDSFKTTQLYKQSVKKKINSLEKDIEQLISGPVQKLDNTDEDLFSEIQQKVEMVLDLTVEELTQLKVVVDEYRSEENHSNGDGAESME